VGAINALVRSRRMIGAGSVGDLASAGKTGGRPDGIFGGRLDPLDGLRAPAIAAVLAYHAELGWPTGAFLAISQFFTLSGFLITTLLLDSDRIRLGRFWARRYRRLLPAAYLALAGIVLFGATVATEQQLDQLPGEILSAILQVANWFFVLTDQSYVGLFSAPSPVQHFWSLAMEEQFYVVLPLLVVAVRRATRSVRALACVLGALAAVSAASMAIAYANGASIDRLYYGTDTRAAEMLIGAVLACVLYRRTISSSTSRTILGAGGVLALAVLWWSWATVKVTDSFMWQGGFVLFALLTACVITSIVTPGSPLRGVLGWGPLPAIGRVSYGLYLFHWPVYLWLTPERTGLSDAPLMTLRLGVTAVLTVISYHFVEMPIRNRAKALPSTRPRLAFGMAAVPTAVFLAGAAFVVGQRDVTTNLAGLGEDLAAAPVQVTAVDDAVVLVVADEHNRSQVASLGQLAREEGIELVRAEEFGCSRTEEGGTCRNWEREWGDLVSRHDPDLVVFAVRDWPPARLAALARSDDRKEQTEWARSALGRGFDELTAGGATVLWSPGPYELGEALRLRHEPFFLAVDRLLTERPDMRRVETGTVRLADLRTYLDLQREASDGAPRVLVVGDSSARTVGYGLERWAAGGERALLWSAGVEGCGIVDDGRVLDETGRSVPVPERCRELRSAWAQQVAAFDPDVVVVLSTSFDLQPRLLDGWKGFLTVGSPRFEEYVADEYVEAFDVLSSGGATVRWLTNPCQREILQSPVRIPDDEAVERFNERVLGDLERRRPGLELFDLHEVLCPDGTYVPGNDEIGVIRPDGVHFSAQGAEWFAEEHGPALVAVG
jgi:peptidoglycan/LPS O-acetylase OafA/YrhL